MTYKDLYTYSQEFHMMETMCLNAYKLLLGRITDFRNKNKKALNIIKSEVSRIYDEHIEKVDGQYQQEKGEWMYKSAMSAMLFDNEIDSLMAKNCTIIF